MKPDRLSDHLPSAAKTAELSERELELLRLVVTGASNKEIAQQLHISVNTVKVHLRNIFEKTGATSRTELAMLAVRRGLVTSASIGEQEESRLDGAIADEAMPPQMTSLLARDTNLARRNRHLLRFVVLALVPVLVVVLFAVWTGGRQLLPIRPTPQALGDVPRWQERAALPEARAGLAVVVYENKLFAIGGETASGVTGAVELYDPASDTWSGRAQKPTPVSDAQAEVLSGRIYLVGGKGLDDKPVDVLEVYDPVADQWHRETSLPQPLSGYALVPFEGDLYVFGGWNGEEYVATVYAYDPELRRWNEKSPLPSGRAFLQAAVVNGKIFVFGGFDGRRALDENWEYSPEKEAVGLNPWEKRASLPEPRYGMGAASLADLIVIVGGLTNHQAQGEAPTVLVYSAYIDQWREYLEPEFVGWNRQEMVLMGMQFYLVGGRVGEELTRRNLLFQPVYTVLLPIVP